MASAPGPPAPAEPAKTTALHEIQGTLGAARVRPTRLVQWPKDQMTKTKLFVSFDFDHDRVLRDFIIGQAKHSDSPFEVADYSLKEAKYQAVWEARARTAIARADKFVVMLGPRTRQAHGVRKEVAMAVALGKPRFQIIGYKAGSRQWAVPDAGKVYRWQWETLKALLAPRRRTFADRYLNG